MNSELRNILASFPTGVAVVTALDVDETPRGLTVSAFCSVSATPPLVLACVAETSNSRGAIQSSGMFTVNILAAPHEDVARLFASKRLDKFEQTSWHPPRIRSGGPILDEVAAAYLVCRVERAIEAGDHWVFIGRVLETGLRRDGLPLLYHRRAFSAVG